MRPSLRSRRLSRLAGTEGLRSVVDELSGVLKLKLGPKVGTMRVDGLCADAEDGGDGPGFLAAADEMQHFELPIRQAGDAPAPIEHGAGDLLADVDLAIEHFADGSQDFVRTL